ncbi:hypothetical protein [Burkholderia multivorans]|uniref:hypothetical protein n=1 Tax=Burkholderia multivorans TaxID=87883 RepID=UPI00265EC7B9|nr:hypothetical protein [Burkholderia multivorans]
MSFAPNVGLPTGLGGSPLGALTPMSSALGGLGGSLASGVAGQLGPLAGLAGHVDTLQRASQLAQAKHTSRSNVESHRQPRSTDNLSVQFANEQDVRLRVINLHDI